MFCYKYDFWHCVFISGGCDLGVLEGIADATVQHLFKPLAKVSSPEVASLPLKEETSKELRQHFLKVPHWGSQDELGPLQGPLGHRISRLEGLCCKETPCSGVGVTSWLWPGLCEATQCLPAAHHNSGLHGNMPGLGPASGYIQTLLSNSHHSWITVNMVEHLEVPFPNSSLLPHPLLRDRK